MLFVPFGGCDPHRGLFAVRDHLGSNLGIISGLGIICDRVSLAALYSANSLKVTIQASFGSPVMFLKTRQGAVLKLCKNIILFVNFIFFKSLRRVCKQRLS